MSKKIYGIPVATPINPSKVDPVVPEEKIAASVSAYMEENPITAESIGALAADKLPEAVDDALAQAKASGEFDGPQGETGATGPQGPKGDTGADGKTPAKGTDYFTPAEIESIANQAAGKVTPEGIGARPNTWLPTIAEIGAAPAGFGYGEVTRLIWWDDSDGTKLEAYLDGMFTDINMQNKVYRYILVDYPVCVVSGQGGYADIVCTDMTGGVPRTILVTFYAVDSSASGSVAIATKKKHNGVWHPWQYVNPPMVPDTEYRTTERHNGKPVYVQLVNMLACPAPGGSKSKAIANAKFISLVGFVDGGNHHTVLPRFDANGKAEINIVDGGDTIWLVATSTASDFTSKNVYVLAKYAKATD